MMPAKPQKRFLLTLILLVFLSIGGTVTWLQFDLWRDVPAFREASGTVVNKEIKDEKHRSGGHTRTRTKHKLTVSFTPEGTDQTITLTENVSDDRFDSVNTGDPIAVFHDPANYQRVVLFERSAGGWTEMILLPLGFVLLPLLMLFWVWKR